MAKSHETRVAVTEQSPLLEAHLIENGAPSLASQHENVSKPSKQNGQLWVLCPLFIGVFIANADTSLVLATYTTISSEFDSLRTASWLLTAYMLSMCSAQPLYGKLSNIFGRKTLLIVSYVFFGIGNAVCGVASNMNTEIAGRAIAGVGGAGMTSVVSYLIADLMPVRDVATWRSYVNIVTTIGRSCGGPLGGRITELVGWRWTFLGQVPPTIIATLLVTQFVPSKAPVQLGASRQGIADQIRRVDFLGSFVLCIGIILFLLPVTMGGNQLPWVHPVILSLFVGATLFVILFSLIESKWAIEPIFPLHLLGRWDIVAPYGILLLQNVAQTFMMYSIPLYFQVTANASPSVAGYYLVPAVLGNTFGGLISAVYIKRTGRYKAPTNMAAFMAAHCHVLLLLRWNGATGPFEAFYALLGGMGTGIAHSSTFIAVTAATTEEELAIAGGGLYLSGGLGSVLGVAAAESTVRTVFKAELTRQLGKSTFTTRIMERLLRDMNYLSTVPDRIRLAAISAYLKGFKWNFGFALICCSISLALGLLMRNSRLPS